MKARPRETTQVAANNEDLLLNTYTITMPPLKDTDHSTSDNCRGYTEMLQSHCAGGIQAQTGSRSW